MAAAAAMALPKIERAHQMYREGRHLEALDFYTEALSIAKTKSQKIALHSNRAACHLKLHDFRKAAEECTSVLELDHQHTGALMLRAQTLVTLKEYQSALFDVNRLMELNPSSEVYKSLQARLKSQLSLTPIPESEEEEEEEEEFDNKTEKQCVEVHLPDKFSESFPTGVECAVSKNEAECTEEVLSQNVTNTLDGTTLLHVQETSRQNKNNESSTIIKEVAVAWRLDADTYATVNPKEQKASSTFFKEATVLSTLDANKNSMVYSNEQKASPTIVEEATATVACRLEASRNATINSKEQKAIPQPKGHSRWDYSRWDQVDSDSSEDDDGSDEEEEQPRYRFRVKTFGACPVK